MKALNLPDAAARRASVPRKAGSFRSANGAFQTLTQKTQTALWMKSIIESHFHMEIIAFFFTTVMWYFLDALEHPRVDVESLLFQSILKLIGPT